MIMLEYNELNHIKEFYILLIFYLCNCYESQKDSDFFPDRINQLVFMAEISMCLLCGTR